MDIFKQVKERADILKVCNILGIKLNRSNMALCPFPNHREKTPSFSVSVSKNIFKCFGCEKSGDAITLVSEMLNITPLESVKFLNTHLGLGIEINNTKYQTREERRKCNASVNKYELRKIEKQFFNKKTNEAFQILCDYLHLLYRLEKKYEPKNLDDDLHEKYVEALQNKHKIEFYIDEYFINGTDEDKKWFLKTNGEVVKKYARKLEQ